MVMVSFALMTNRGLMLNAAIRFVGSLVTAFLSETLLNGKREACTNTGTESHLCVITPLSGLPIDIRKTFVRCENLGA